PVSGPRRRGFSVVAYLSLGSRSEATAEVPPPAPRPKPPSNTFWFCRGGARVTGHGHRHDRTRRSTSGLDEYVVEENDTQGGRHYPVYLLVPEHVVVAALVEHYGLVLRPHP